MLVWTFVISLITVCIDAMLKQAAVTKNTSLLSLGVFLYGVDAVLWYWVYKTAKFTTVGIVYSLFTILLSIGIGMYVFHEHLGVREVAGVVLGCLSIVLLSKYL